MLITTHTTAGLGTMAETTYDVLVTATDAMWIVASVVTMP